MKPEFSFRLFISFYVFLPEEPFDLPVRIANQGIQEIRAYHDYEKKTT